MRLSEPFQPSDLAELDERLLSRAEAIVAMEDVHAGARNPGTIGMRHDCDNVIEPAVALAEWEAERGYRSTYYVLHTAPYWQDKALLRRSLERIAECGHEIGIHNNAVTAALLTGRQPAEILAEAIDELRGYGHPVCSTVAHGDPLCHQAVYVNDEMFAECARSSYGNPTRTLRHERRRMRIRPVALASLGLEFDSNWLSRSDYVSDSGGRWSRPFGVTVAAFPPLGGQLHMLIHPDWWGEAFSPVLVAATKEA